MKVLVKNAPLPVAPPQPAQVHQCDGCGTICELQHSELRRVTGALAMLPTPPLWWRCPECKKDVIGSKHMKGYQ